MSWWGSHEVKYFFFQLLYSFSPLWGINIKQLVFQWIPRCFSLRKYQISSNPMTTHLYVLCKTWDFYSILTSFEANLWWFLAWRWLQPPSPWSYWSFSLALPTFFGELLGVDRGCCGLFQVHRFFKCFKELLYVYIILYECKRIIYNRRWCECCL